VLMVESCKLDLFAMRGFNVTTSWRISSLLQRRENWQKPKLYKW